MAKEKIVKNGDIVNAFADLLKACGYKDIIVVTGNDVKKKESK